MDSLTRQIVIPPEKAVFWMDGNGNWHNEHGKFGHPRIIAYFNRSIRKDDQGYHLCQTNGDTVEKVYFSHEGTAVFVVDIAGQTLILNTSDTLELIPEQMFIRKDSLYLQTPEHCIKFTDRALMKLSGLLQESEGRIFLELSGVRHEIPEMPEASQP
jgi:hypothetical protein